MSQEGSVPDFERVVEDVYRHSLGPLKSEFERLVFLSSLRPSGVSAYQHEGLSMLYGTDSAVQALERCHREVFRGLMSLTLEGQHDDLERCLAETEEDPRSLSKHWQDQQFYRTLVPDTATPLLKKIFMLNCERLLLLVQMKKNPAPSRNHSRTHS
ncbi:MAG: hypothetical protein PHX83_03495 [Acidobacteriia bacterium]|nr:hypothetical protein [Terriglobia bacterium]